MSFLLPRSAASRTYARSATTSGGENLTFEEWAVLVPSVQITGAQLEALRTLQTQIEEIIIPGISAAVRRNPLKLKQKGFQIPARFLPKEPTKEEIVASVGALLQKVMDEGYAPGV